MSAESRPLRSTIVIPARLASTRLPRKLLLAETGKPLVQHTYEAASRATRTSGVLVAADCEEIAAVVRSFGGRVELTSPDCASGTDRVAEIARKLPDVDVLVNVQGDEPEISAAAIDLAVELLERDPTAVMSTLATPIREKTKLHDPACVKVIFDSRGRAIYFSRAADSLRPQLGRLAAHRRAAALLSAHRPVRLSPRVPARACRRCHEPASSSVENLEQLRVLDAGHTHPRRRDRRTDDRHRHARGLPGVCGAVPARRLRGRESIAVTIIHDGWSLPQLTPDPLRFSLANGPPLAKSRHSHARWKLIGTFVRASSRSESAGA